MIINSVLVKKGTSPKEEQTKTVTEPDFSSGDVVITPDAGKVLTQVIVVKDSDLVPENIVKDVNIFGVVGTAETGGGGLTGGYSVVYRSDYFSAVPSWISITLTFVDDTTASYAIKALGGGSRPHDWEHYVGGEDDGAMVLLPGFGPYVWNNVKSVSITAHTEGAGTFPLYLEINGVNVGTTYNATLDRNILVHNGGGGPF